MPHNIFRKVILPLVLWLSVFTVSAQNQNIRLSDKSLIKKEVILQLEQQTPYTFSYSKSTFDDQKKVDFPHTDLKLQDVIDRLVEATGHTYHINNNSILIYSDIQAEPEEPVVSRITQHNISGTVTDALGNSLEGVSVEIVGLYNTEATTNAAGHFIIKQVSPGEHMIKMTSADGETIRYSTVALKVGSDIDVTLQLDQEFISSKNKEQDTEPSSTAKTTAYFAPTETEDNTIRAFTDQPKTEYNFIPSGNINNNYLPKTALKTNLLLLGTTTPNIGLEFGLAMNWTLDIATGYNPFKLQDGGINRVGFLQSEIRYWFCQRFEKHFIGFHGLWLGYNIGQVDIPFADILKENRYDGYGIGAGFSYGYQLPMGKRWAWEFTLGVGYIRLEHDKFKCYECDEFTGKQTKHYFGPTKAGVSLMFMIK